MLVSGFSEATLCFYNMIFLLEHGNDPIGKDKECYKG